MSFQDGVPVRIESILVQTLSRGLEDCSLFLVYHAVEKMKDSLLRAVLHGSSKDPSFNITHSLYSKKFFT